MDAQTRGFSDCLDPDLGQLDSLDNIINFQQLEEFIVNETNKQQLSQLPVSQNSEQYIANTDTVNHPYTQFPSEPLTSSKLLAHNLQLPESPPDSGSEPYSPPQYDVAISQPNGAPPYQPHVPASVHPDYRTPPTSVSNMSPPISVEPCDPIIVKKRRYSDTIKQECDVSPGAYSPDPSNGLGNVNCEVIKWQNYEMQSWTKIYDQNHFEIPLLSYRVDADKGFNFSVPDDSFVCQKKNHFQVTVHSGFQGDPHYLKDLDGQLKLIDHFALHFNGVKMESLSQEIKVEQSQSNRSKRAFYPVRFDLQSQQVAKVTVGRLHFSETTSNNMRKKGKPNPDQRFILLVVKMCAHLCGAVDCCSGNASATIHPVVASSISERIIVRASNPGQFDNDGDQIWQKGVDGAGVYHVGKVSVNTDRCDEALTVHGNIKLSGRLVQPSDRRVKTNITELDTVKQLENIQQLKVYNYMYGEDYAKYAGMSLLDRHDTGVLAQELSKVLPDAVRNHGDLTLPSGHLINDFQVINKDRIFMENIGAVKQLCKVTDRLENRIYELESLNRMLTKMNTGLLRSSIKSSISMNSLSMPPPLMGFKRDFSKPLKKKEFSLSDSVCTVSINSSKERKTKEKQVLTNRFIHIAIFVLVLIMSFCIILITCLYVLDNNPTGNQHHLKGGQVWRNTTRQDDGTGHRKTKTPPLLPSYCGVRHCQAQCCGSQDLPANGVQTGNNGITLDLNATSPGRNYYTVTYKPNHAINRTLVEIEMGKSSGVAEVKDTKYEDTKDENSKDDKLTEDKQNEQASDKEITTHVTNTVISHHNDNNNDNEAEEKEEEERERSNNVADKIDATLQPEVRVHQNRREVNEIHDKRDSEEGQDDEDITSDNKRSRHRRSDGDEEEEEEATISERKTKQSRGYKTAIPVDLLENSTAITTTPPSDWSTPRNHSNSVRDEFNNSIFNARVLEIVLQQEESPPINLTYEYCYNKRTCMNQEGGLYFYNIPMSSRYPLTSINVTFTLFYEGMNISFCGATKHKSCSSNHSFENVTKMEDAVNTWSLPIGYYFRSSYQFKVAYENTTSGEDICSMSNPGEQFAEFNFNFNRDCRHK